MLLNSLCAREPCDPILSVLFHPGFQRSLMKMKVVDGPDAKNTVAPVSRADSIHEGATSFAKFVGHAVPRRDGVGLNKGAQVVLATDEFDVVVGHHEIGGEHRGSDLAAVEAVADEGVIETRLGGWERQLDGAAVAGCCGTISLGKAIRSAPGRRDVCLTIVFGSHCVFERWGDLQIWDCDGKLCYCSTD